ncbi:MAG: YbaK/EbsC family protein, partial [Gammaproteobacteria bacterium]|nr:YbaK/EbsC family protein [Gammaproteobacteria bacterium]
MAIAGRVERYLIEHRVPYDVVGHAHTESSLQTARAVHMDAERIAKAVMLRDERGPLLAVIPASHRLRLNTLRDQLGRDLELVPEAELAEIFPDCALGAVPAFGPAYGLDVALDERLLEQAEVFVEAGDHEELVGVSGE